MILQILRQTMRAIAITRRCLSAKLAARASLFLLCGNVTGFARSVPAAAQSRMFIR